MNLTHTHKFSLLSFLLIFIFTSCSKEDDIIKPENNVVKIETLNYKGLTVKNRFALKKEKIILDKADDFFSVLKEYKLEKRNLNEKGLSLDEDLVFEEALESAERVLPYFPFEEDGTNLEMIKYDFPDLTQEEIEESIDVIDEFYGRALNEAIVQDMENPDYFDNYEDVFLEVYNVPVNNNPPVIPTHTTKRQANEGTEDCVKRVAGITNMDFRQLYASAFATKNAKLFAESRYPNLDPNITKRGAFRHTLWNALLCRKYWTISSKKKKIDFAKKIADANEDCGNNGVGTLYMDYHNNQIGRNIFAELAKFRKNWFGWIYGLSQPTEGNLDQYIYDYIEEKAVFIDMRSFSGNDKEQEEKAYLEIIKVDKSEPIYLSTQSGSSSCYGNGY